MSADGKRIRLGALAALLCAALLLGGCGERVESGETAVDGGGTAVLPTAVPTPKPTDGSGLPDECFPADGLYPAAMVTGTAELRDGGANEGVWRGVKTCAFANGAAYKYYVASGDGEDERFQAMKAAAESGARIVLCTGAELGPAMARAAFVYPEVSWVRIDGGECLDANGGLLTNSAGIDFDRLLCGYLAGWAAVTDGYTRLGFAGAGGGLDEDCRLCGYGFAQGASAAAAELGVEVELKFTWLYGADYAASDRLTALLRGWYETGTELVLPCGGDLFDSALAAAEAGGGRVVGLETDRSGESEAVLCSVLYNYEAAAYYAMNAYFHDRWTALSGQTTTLGLADGAVSLCARAEAWRFETLTADDCRAMLERGPAIDGDCPEAMDGLELPGLELELVD